MKRTLKYAFLAAVIAALIFGTMQIGSDHSSVRQITENNCVEPNGLNADQLKLLKEMRVAIGNAKGDYTAGLRAIRDHFPDNPERADQLAADFAIQWWGGNNLNAPRAVAGAWLRLGGHLTSELKRIDDANLAGTLCFCPSPEENILVVTDLAAEDASKVGISAVEYSFKVWTFNEDGSKRLAVESPKTIVVKAGDDFVENPPVMPGKLPLPPLDQNVELLITFSICSVSKDGVSTPPFDGSESVLLHHGKDSFGRDDYEFKSRSFGRQMKLAWLEGRDDYRTTLPRPAMPSHPPAADPKHFIGHPLPPILLESDGSQDPKILPSGPFQLKPVSEKHVSVVSLWATWCGPCFAEMPVLSEISQWPGVDVYSLAISAKPNDAKRPDGEFLQFFGCLGAGMSEKLEADAIPKTFIIGKDGNVAEVLVGFDADGVKKAVHAALAKK